MSVNATCSSICGETGTESCAPARTSGSPARAGALRHPGLSRTGLLRNCDERDGSDPSHRTAAVPRPAGHGTCRRGRSPQPGPGGHPRLGRPRRRGRRGAARQRTGDQRDHARDGRDRHAWHPVLRQPPAGRRARHVACFPGGDRRPRRRGDRTWTHASRHPGDRVGLLPDPRRQGRVLHAPLRRPPPGAGQRLAGAGFKTWGWGRTPPTAPIPTHARGDRVCGRRGHRAA
jgi:hypothetical protein